MGGHQVHRQQDRLRAANAARLGPPAWIDDGQREGVSTLEVQRIKELEREVRELRKANGSWKLASAFFAQAELDRRIKS